MSYFDTEEMPLVNYTGTHRPYVGRQYKNSPVFCKAKRSAYIDDMTRWLNEPVNMMGVIISERDIELKRKDVIFTSFARMVRKLRNEGCEFYDEQQLKEDYVHYIYSVTRLKGTF